MTVNEARREAKQYIPQQGQGEVTHLKVQVDYEEGGYGRERGYYLTISPVVVEQKDGYKVEKYTGFTGVYHLIEKTSRYNRKKLQQHAENWRNCDQLEAMLEQVNQNAARFGDGEVASYTLTDGRVA